MRVLVARLDSLGDVLLCGPAVRAVAARHHVTMLCSRLGAPAARLLPGVDDVLVWNSPWIMPNTPINPADVLSLQETVRAGAFDEAVILTSFHQSPLPLALVLRLAGVPRVIGASVDYAGALLDVRLRPGEDFDEDQPEPERALLIAKAAGHVLPPQDEGLLAVTAPPDTSSLTGPGPYLVVHPGASAPARAWPASHHAELVRILAGQGHRVIVTGGNREKTLTATVAGTTGVDLGGRLDLPELAGVLARARVLVVGNTGPAHLAAAVGTPVVSLFSPVVPAARWAPYGVPHVVLGDQEAPCRGSRARTCPVPGHPCLAGVSPSSVADAVHQLLARPAAASAAHADHRLATEAGAS
ncbi:MAG TPA: glycosyltransferase family 9 protein [Propionibacteriaceae bacterium]|nr:glycosyltransferase family 9 protein [Propionibacteriaceae bacterium]